MTQDNFGSDNITPPQGPAPSPQVPPAPNYGLPPVAPPTAGYGQSAPVPNATPTYGQVPPAYPPAPNNYSPVVYPPAGQPGNLASFGKRAYGALVDWGPIWLLGGINGGFSYSSGGSLMLTLLSIAAFAYAIYNIGYLGGKTGVTFGRKIAGTRLVSEATMQPIGTTNGIIRYFVHFLDAIICGIGFLFPLFTAKKQTIADMIMKTVVIQEN